MNLAQLILDALDKQGSVGDSKTQFPDVESSQIQAAVTSLAARSMVTFKPLEKEIWQLTAEGNEIVVRGSHEIRLYDEVLARDLDGLKIKDVVTVLGESGKVGQQRAFKNGWIKKNKDALVVGVSPRPQDHTALMLQEIQHTGELADPDSLSDLKKRKLVTRTRQISYSIERGPEFSVDIKKLETDLTVEMIQSGNWRSAQFKPYNFAAEGVPVEAGALHPLMKVREEFRQIFFSMGFTEMPTNRYVESGFWNFDALFVPQQHPARDLQDTFYIKDPGQAGHPQDKQYWDKVKAVHEGGVFGSVGYRYKWDEAEALRLVLRTHTTAVSSNLLHKLAQSMRGAKVPATRYFSVDRVFRNEAVDATHLAEFHQVEGCIADYNLTLGDLIGFMQQFFSQMGVHDLRFKPTYNPYTEPSLEIYAWHHQLAKWVEIGNSGLFRAEMLEPMGLPRDLRAIGFGLSLERPTMIKYHVSNIRELLGHKVDLNFIQRNPAVRLDELV